MTDTTRKELSDSIDGLTNEVKLLRETMDEFVEVFEWAVQNYQKQANCDNWSQTPDLRFSEVRTPDPTETGEVEKECNIPKSPDLLF